MVTDSPDRVSQVEARPLKAAIVCASKESRNALSHWPKKGVSAVRNEIHQTGSQRKVAHARGVRCVRGCRPWLP